MSSNLSHYKLPYFLEEDFKKNLLEKGMTLKYEEWTDHYSTKSNNKTGLYYYDLHMTFCDKKCFLVMIPPNGGIYFHTDGGTRNTALSYPLSDDYAPCVFENGEKVNTPMFLNTQVKHAVFNNEKTRISFNISFQEDIEDCVKIFERLEKYEFKTS
tara:strand:- start:1812 stop:2279 length:468 start_codon:yes stop_codon:yes gene_type:complete